MKGRGYVAKTLAGVEPGPFTRPDLQKFEHDRAMMESLMTFLYGGAAAASGGTAALVGATGGGLIPAMGLGTSALFNGARAAHAWRAAQQHLNNARRARAGYPTNQRGADVSSMADYEHNNERYLDGAPTIDDAVEEELRKLNPSRPAMVR